LGYAVEKIQEKPNETENRTVFHISIIKKLDRSRGAMIMELESGFRAMFHSLYQRDNLEPLFGSKKKKHFFYGCQLMTLSMHATGLVLCHTPQARWQQGRGACFSFKR
jgi:hypothetical protein